jgi:hypothetical protein
MAHCIMDLLSFLIDNKYDFLKHRQHSVWNFTEILLYILPLLSCNKQTHTGFIGNSTHLCSEGASDPIRHSNQERNLQHHMSSLWKINDATEREIQYTITTCFNH